MRSTDRPKTAHLCFTGGARSQDSGLYHPAVEWAHSHRGPGGAWLRNEEGTDGSHLAAADKRAALLAQSEWRMLVSGRTRRPGKGGKMVLDPCPKWEVTPSSCQAEREGWGCS